jgi:hypothetical protein
LAQDDSSWTARDRGGESVLVSVRERETVTAQPTHGAGGFAGFGIVEGSWGEASRRRRTEAKASKIRQRRRRRSTGFGKCWRPRGEEGLLYYGSRVGACRVACPAGERCGVAAGCDGGGRRRPRLRRLLPPFEGPHLPGTVQCTRAHPQIPPK